MKYKYILKFVDFEWKIFSDESDFNKVHKPLFVKQHIEDGHFISFQRFNNG